MVLLVVLTGLVQAIAWVAIVAAGPPLPSIGFALLASSMSAAGVAGSAIGSRRSTAWGWSLQAVGIALLAISWVIAAG